MTGDPALGAAAHGLDAARAFSDHVPQMLWLADPEGQIIHCNRRLIDEFAYDFAHDPDRWNELIHPDDFDRVGDIWREALVKGEPYDVELRVRTPQSRRWRWYRSAAMPVRDTDGAIAWWSGTVSLTDARHRLQSALRATADALSAGERRFQIALDTVPALVYEMDLADGRILGLFGSEKLLGSPGADLPNLEDFLARVHPDDLEHVVTTSREATANHVPFEVEYRARHQRGHYVWIHQNARTFYAPDGRPQRRVGVMMDVTARRTAVDQLREADTRKNEFLGILAHELRNPLAVLRAGVDLISRRPDQPPAERTVSILDNQLRTLTRLVGDLLDITRIGRGIFRLDRSAVDLVELIGQVRHSMERRISDRGQRLIVDCPSDPIPIHADVDRLHQIFINLLVNASSYTQQDGTIELLVERQSNEVTVTIRDDGEGIEPELLPRIFDLFTQGDNSLARSTVGLGIGLHLVRRLVEGHGGRIEAHSEGKGRGSTFRIHLPITPGVTPTSIVPTPVIEPLDVLVVDDNLDYLDHVAPLLREHGHTVDTAPDGPSALARVAERRYDLILLDIGLPGMNGFELATALRKTLGSDVVLVAVSGYDQPDDRDRSARAGVDHHLGKPLDLAALNRFLARRPTN